MKTGLSSSTDQRYIEDTEDVIETISQSDDPNEARVMKEKDFISRKFQNHSLEETQQASSNRSELTEDKL